MAFFIRIVTLSMMLVMLLGNKAFVEDLPKETPRFAKLSHSAQVLNKEETFTGVLHHQ